MLDNRGLFESMRRRAAELKEKKPMNDAHVDLLTSLAGVQSFQATKARTDEFYAKLRWVNPNPSAREWDEDLTTWSEKLCLKASSYHVPLLFPDVPVAVYGSALEKVVSLSPHRKYGYANRLLPAGQRLPLIHGKDVGEVWFDEHVIIPVTFPVSRPNLVTSSLTPQRLLTGRPGVKKAKGKVLICGTVQGWFLRAVAAKPSVTEIIILCSDEEVAGWYVERLARETPKVKDLIVDKDVYKHIGEHGAKTRYLYNAWQDYGAAKGDSAWQKAKQKAEHVWGWGDVQT